MPRTRNMLALASRASEIVFKQRKWGWAQRQLRAGLCVQRVAFEYEAFPRRKFLYLRRTTQSDGTITETLFAVRESNIHEAARLTWADLQAEDWSTRKQLNLVTTSGKEVEP